MRRKKNANDITRTRGRIERNPRSAFAATGRGRSATGSVRRHSRTQTDRATSNDRRDADMCDIDYISIFEVTQFMFQ